MLVMVKSLQMARRASSKLPAILNVLIRDSVFYFAGILVVIFTNLITWGAVRVSLMRHRVL